MYFNKVINNNNPYIEFSNEKYQISLNEMRIIGNGKENRRIKYGVYIENKNCYLLTNIQIIDNYVVGRGSYVKKYCELDILENKTLEEIEKDAYNYYMTIAH